MNATDGPRYAQVKPPWWLWALPAIVAVVVIAALSGGFDIRAGGESAAAQRTASADAIANAGPTIGDARNAVDDDRYEAIEIVAGLDDGALRSILRRIANRLGERAIKAVRVGDRQRARALVIAAKTYPPTHRTRVAYATYKRATARAERDDAKTETAAGGDTATPTAKAPA